MSIEPQCVYCNAVDKNRCKTQLAADDCDTYKRMRARKAEIDAARKPKGVEPPIEATQRRMSDAVRDEARRIDPTRPTNHVRDNKNVSVQFGVGLSGTKHVTISSHDKGVADRFCLKFTSDVYPSSDLALTKFDLDTLINVLLQMQDYTKPMKGTR